MLTPADNRKSLVRTVMRVVAILALAASARTAEAYVGPGAGFAFVSSFVLFFTAFVLAVVVFLTSPIRFLIRLVRRRRRAGKSRCRRVVIVGLDGMSPVLADRMMKEGRLPNFAALADQGSFSPLRSTLPSASPVAWSTFQTGTNPGKHNIFDFLTRNPKNYMPDLSSAWVHAPSRSLKVGRYRLSIGRPRVIGKRKSLPFWKTLGEHGVFSIVLRVPITFPPETFEGVILSGMCVPDLRGTQGSFTYFTTDGTERSKHESGLRIVVTRKGDIIRSAIPGPVDPNDPDGRTLEAPFTATVNEENGSVAVRFPGEEVTLRLREFSPWIRLRFRAGLGRTVTGICRFYLREVSPEFQLYVTPINIDPERPALPLSHPFVYSAYLAKTFGPYATLGLAEDTWALNESVIDEGTFLDLAHDIHKERETMFFDSLEKIDYGMAACVFDLSDRVQHMFWQYTPEARAAGSRPGESEHAGAVEAVYEQMDGMIGRLLQLLNRDDVLIVMSDHGFGTFQRCVNLNAWLRENGLLVMKDDAASCEGYFRNVDWPRTKAYAVGLGGIFINQAGRESSGIVQAGEEKEAVKSAIASGLKGLRDNEKQAAPVRHVFDTSRVYSGPYVDNAPDLIVGFADGYRVSWDSVIGKFDATVITDNEKAWSGDHCIDPDLVPGVLFCNRRIAAERPGIIDIAPTVLDLFGVPIPKYMDGRPLLSTVRNGDAPGLRDEGSQNRAG